MDTYFQVLGKIVTGLRAFGFSEKMINDLMLWAMTGEEQYEEALRSDGMTERPSQPCQTQDPRRRQPECP